MDVCHGGGVLPHSRFFLFLFFFFLQERNGFGGGEEGEGGEELGGGEGEEEKGIKGRRRKRGAENQEKITKKKKGPNPKLWQEEKGNNETKNETQRRIEILESKKDFRHSHKKKKALAIKKDNLARFGNIFGRTHPLRKLSCMKKPYK